MKTPVEYNFSRIEVFKCFKSAALDTPGVLPTETHVGY